MVKTLLTPRNLWRVLTNAFLFLLISGGLGMAVRADTVVVGQEQFFGDERVGHDFQKVMSVISLAGLLRGRPEVRVIKAGQLILGSHSLGNVSPAWSPDGHKIAYQLVSSRGPRLHVNDLLLRNIKSDVWVVNEDGSDNHALTKDGRSGEPAWGQPTN